MDSPIQHTGETLAIEKTPVQYGLNYIQDKYTEFRNRFFGGDSGPLPQMLPIKFNNRTKALGTCQISLTRKRNNGWGRTVTDEWVNGCTIYLSNAYDFSPKLLDEVLIHEMIHAFLAYESVEGIHEGHGIRFQTKCNEINSASDYHVTTVCDQELNLSQGKLNSVSRDNSVIIVAPYTPEAYIVSRCSDTNAAWFARGMHDWLKSEPRCFLCDDGGFKNKIPLKKSRVGGLRLSRERIDEMVASGVLREVDIPKSDMSENTLLVWPVENGRIDYALVNKKYARLNADKIYLLCHMRGLESTVYQYSPTGEFDGWPSRPNTDTLFSAKTDRATIDGWVRDGKIVPVIPLPGTAVTEAIAVPRQNISPLVEWVVREAGLPRNAVDNYVRGNRSDVTVQRAIGGDVASRYLVAKRVGVSLGIQVFEDAFSMQELVDASRVNSMTPRDEAVSGGGEALFEVVKYMKGHRNSKGEAAPWVIVQHDTGKILSSHTSKKKADEHLRQMEYYKHAKAESVVEAPVTDALMEAYEALTESVKPGPAAMKAIMNIVPAPADGWNGPAFNSDGFELVSERSGERFTWISALEAGLKNEFYHGSGIAPKFEPGLARIAYGELGFWPEAVEDWRTQRPTANARAISELKSIAAEISSVTHRSEYTSDLNGDTFQQLHELFRGKVDDEKDSGRQFDNRRYEVVHINNFDEARSYSKDVGWCICNSRSYWNQYSAKGYNKCYFILEQGYKDIPENAGEGAPLDRYGLSMIGLFVSPDGKIAYCCCRWNHRYGGTDHMLSKPEISRLIGRDFDSVCTPFSEDELAGRSAGDVSPELLQAKLMRYIARGIKDIDGLNEILQADFGTDAEIEDLGDRAAGWRGYYLVTLGDGMVIAAPDGKLTQNYFEESIEVHDDWLIVLQSGYEFNEEHDQGEDNSVALLHRKYGKCDLTEDFSIYSDVSVWDTGIPGHYVVEDTSDMGMSYAIDANGWSIDFSALNISKVGQLFVLDEYQDKNTEIPSDNENPGDDRAFRIYAYANGGIPHRITPGETGGCTFNCVSCSDEAVAYIIDNQAMIVSAKNALANGLPKQAAVPGKYVSCTCDNDGVTLVDEKGSSTFFTHDGRKLLSVPGCTKYGMRGDNLVVAINDDTNKALYTVDGHCIVPSRPGWSFKFLTGLDNRHIGMINDLGVSLCDISSGRPINMFKGTFDLKEIKGGYFENGKCVAVTRDADQNYHVLDRNMQDTIRPFNRDYSVTCSSTVIYREVDGKTKYNLLSESYDEILPEDADWASQYVDKENKRGFLVAGFIVGYDNGMKLLCNREINSAKDIIGPFIDIEVKEYYDHTYDYDEYKEKLACTRPGGKVEYYMPSINYENWEPAEGNG